MTIERIPITDRAQWLARRKYDINASTVGAIFGLHPYVSPLRLYVEKQGLVDLPPPEGAMLRRGRIMESAVGAAVAEERPQWTIAKAEEYLRDPDISLAATPDFWIHGDPRGLGSLQGKTALPSVFARDWTEERPPMWIVLQAATEMMLADCAFGAVAVLIISPAMECRIYEIERHASAEQKIRDAVIKFWDDIEKHIEPGPDYGLDRDLLSVLSPKETPEKTVNFDGDNEIMAGLIERAELKERIKIDEAKCKAIETMIMARMRDAGSAIVPDFKITWRVEHRKGYTVEPSDPRVLRIYDKRKD